MRIRFVSLAALALLVVPLVATPIHALAADRVVAQDQESDEPGADETTEGSGSEAAEGDAPAEVEEGPLWTYQMAWISIVLLVLMLVSMANGYRKFVTKRVKQGI